ncbi:MAG TPA: hypothetical protein VIM22_05175 [Solirubrobacteraceae bacterium]|jgi:Mn2+/Fe2+ NRAMP family transporter
MGLLIATVTGLAVWIVLWAVGSKAFDSFMIAMAIVVIAATARILAPYIPGNQADE